MNEGMYFEDYTADWQFETAPKTVTEAHVAGFVALHEFNTPTFTDPAYALKSRDHGGRMAPGLLVLSLAEGLVLNAGLTRRRGIFLMALSPEFKKPVMVGDTLVNRVRLHEKRLTRRPDRGVVITAHEVINQKGELVLSYHSTRMIRTRLYVEDAPVGANSGAPHE